MKLFLGKIWTMAIYMFFFISFRLLNVCVCVYNYHLKIFIKKRCATKKIDDDGPQYYICEKKSSDDYQKFF